MADDASPWHSPSTPASKGNGRGCSRGCLLSGLAAFALILVFGGGIGFPNTYWHHLGVVQAFEGPDRVILFVEIERVTKRPGFLREGTPTHTAAFLRIDIFPDGRIEQTDLRSDLAGKDIPNLSDRSSLRSYLNTISAEGGWQRLHDESGDGPYPSPLGLINSARHGVKLRQVGRSWRQGTPQSIVAESLSPADRWTRTLIEVDTQTWESYKAPGDRAYLRERYAADPAR